MTSWLFTVYSVRTMITEIEAEDIEEAKKKIEEEGAGLSWLQIPETTFSFFSMQEPEDVDPS